MVPFLKTFFPSTTPYLPHGVWQKGHVTTIHMLAHFLQPKARGNSSSSSLGPRLSLGAVTCPPSEAASPGFAQVAFLVHAVDKTRQKDQLLFFHALTPSLVSATVAAAYSSTSPPNSPFLFHPWPPLPSFPRRSPRKARQDDEFGPAAVFVCASPWCLCYLQIWNYFKDERNSV